jgi:RNA polymerase-binding protein DksA
MAKVTTKGASPSKLASSARTTGGGRSRAVKGAAATRTARARTAVKAAPARAAKAPAKKTAVRAAKKTAVKRSPGRATKAPARTAGARTTAKRPPAKVAKAPAKRPPSHASQTPAKRPPTRATKTPAVTRSPAKVVKAPARTPTLKPAPAKAGPAPKPPARTKARPVLDRFLLEQRALLLAERETYGRQAEEFKAEADQLATEMEPGESEFSEEGGEGGNLSVERELDLVLSAQARQAVEEIDKALAKIDAGTYGLCEKCGQPIPRLRLKALPAAPLCVACKSGGLSRR